jgi:hypothetical protein
LILFDFISGYCLPLVDNFGKGKRTFENFSQSFTNGKLDAKKDESELLSHGKSKYSLSKVIIFLNTYV